MSKSKGQQPPAYRGCEEEVGSSSSSAAIPLPIQGEPDRSGEGLPEYHDGADGSTQSVGKENGGGVRGVERGETEGEVDTDAPPKFEVYVPKVKPVNTVRPGKSLTISHDEHLNTDGEALYRWLLEQRSRPPRVYIHIQGTHPNPGDGSLVTDFDLVCDLTHLLLEQNHMGEPTLATVPPNQRVHRGHRRLKSIAKELEEGWTVRDWADKYCKDQSVLKE
ncbi:hypothetical protein HOY80DRAFT_1011276 [Tuber brumale]|nr:hypothetical protein HOY80DRAFT_1011276 [Tuber brumale]